MAGRRFFFSIFSVWANIRNSTGGKAGGRKKRKKKKEVESL
jgi:hypothetical protein